MQVERLGLVILAATLCACGGKKKEGEGGAAKPATRREICAQLAKDSVRAAEVAAAGLASGLGEGEGLSDEERAELRAELNAGASEFEATCMEWPEEVFDCIRRRDQGEKCQDAVAAVMGGDVKPPEAPEGPKPAWTAKLPDRPRRVLLAGGGLVVGVLEDKLVAWKDGKALWERAYEDADEVRADADGTLWVMSYQPFVQAIDPATGKDVYKLAVPAPPKPDEGELAVSGNVRVWAEAPGGAVVLATSDARFFSRPPGCKATRCIKPIGSLPDEELDGDAELSVGPDGMLVLHEFGLLRGFDEKLAPIFRVHGHDFFPGAEALAGRIVTTALGREILNLAADACRSEKPIVLRAPSGNLGEAEDDCDDCVPPPPGCVAARKSLPEPDYVTPALGPYRVYQVTDEGLTALAWPRLEPVWTLKMPAAGRPVWSDGQVLVVCYAPTPGRDPDSLDDSPMALCAVGPDGKLTWRTPLGFAVPMIFGIDDLWLEARDGHLLTGYREHVVVLPAPGGAPAPTPLPK